jgi:hypothetical protein
MLERGRGIAFTDKKGVRTKGSEVGFALSKIEEKAIVFFFDTTSRRVEKTK